MKLFNAMIAGFILIVGVPSTALAKSSGGPDMATARAESYNGPKARIAVADFEDKMSSQGQYRSEYGRGMADMLTTSLFNTNRYIVLEREKLKAVIAEQSMGASGLFKKETAIPLGELEGAELIVTAAITGFDPGAAGGGGNLSSFLGSAGDKVGSVIGAFKKAHTAMDLRVIDIRTGRIISATNVEGSATTFGGGTSLTGVDPGGTLGGFAKTPMETAIREMIQKGVDFIVAKTPQTYYHYTADGQLIGGAPEAKKVDIQTIHTDFDKDLVAHLSEVKRRGVVLSVTITLTLEGSKKESETVTVSKDKSAVMDYDTGQTYPLITMDGFEGGRVQSGEVKTLHTTFKGPKDSKSVGITVSGIGTFEDVKLE